ncbi:hypothetical protein L2E82_29723 [Cichorium intybus]|uniref:Uncharacterized protein n=1 Tax=Cichorium intybus TaxID=13427 RepID=A0ACB9CYF4_CICIN|nr:hypothetical protein L2E82_29723 [Cichorium intybus]
MGRVEDGEVSWWPRNLIANNNSGRWDAILPQVAQLRLPRKKLEDLYEQFWAIEIRCFSAECNTEDLLCVQIKNVSPSHAPDIIIYLDAITVIFEESSKDGPPSSLPVSCIEAGNNHGLPDLPLRKVEEHSFILKPTTSVSSCNVEGERSYQLLQLRPRSARSSVYTLTNMNHGASSSNRYAVLVSCRSNYTGEVRRRASSGNAPAFPKATKFSVFLSVRM